MMSLGFFALPLAKTQAQVKYKPVSELNKSYGTIYSLGGIAPEVIYNYGDKIPPLKTEEGLVIPKEKEFKLLTDKKNPEDFKKISKLYNIKHIETYDLNFSNKDYKSRLVNELYKLTLK